MKKEKKYISILSDYGFKVTFADQADTGFLRRALQAVLKIPYKITEVEFMRNEVAGLTVDSRGGLYDLLCKDEKNNIFIVEMQLGEYKQFIHRSKFYVFHQYNTLVKKGKYLFDNLTPIYSIGFLAINIFPNSEQYYHKGLLRNQEGEIMDDQIVHIIIEISKFVKTEEELETDLDKLLYFMKNQQQIFQSAQNQAILDEAWIDDMIQKLETSNLTPSERAAYEHAIAKNASIIKMWENDKQRAIKKALDKALQEAAVEAAEKADREAAEKAKNQAIFLKKNGVDLKIISETTGIPIDEIERM